MQRIYFYSVLVYNIFAVVRFILRIIMPAVDKSLVGLIIGPLVGLLVMKGLVAPQNADSITQFADTVVGGAIALVTIIGYIEHHAKKTPSQQTTITQTTIDPTPETEPAGQQ